jgi:hypothetical protein
VKVVVATPIMVAAAGIVATPAALVSVSVAMRHILLVAQCHLLVVLVQVQD